MKRLVDLFGKWMTPRVERADNGDVDAETSDQIDELRDQIRRDVASAFYDEDMILKNAADAFADDLDADVLRTQAQQFLREALRAQSQASRHWPDVTDCDRLDAAFAELEAAGIVCRQNFTCCGTCGSAEIWDEIVAAEEDGLRARGYAFYHIQDTDAAVDGGGVFLSYGACDDGEAAAIAIGRAIVAEISAHGLTVEWDGSWDRKIQVALKWQRRR